MTDPVTPQDTEDIDYAVKQVIGDLPYAIVIADIPGSQLVIGGDVENLEHLKQLFIEGAIKAHKVSGGDTNYQWMHESE